MHRWKEVMRVRWKEEEHQNVLELRGALLFLQNCLRFQDRWAKRILLISDSQVVIGCMMKGRSRSIQLNTILRRIAAYVMATHSLVYVRWIESDRNHADGPSRGFPK